MFDSMEAVEREFTASEVVAMVNSYVNRGLQKARRRAGISNHEISPARHVQELCEHQVSKELHELSNR